ncbi:fructosamine kinase family protein [Synechococcus sp. CCY 9618]|uniref:fructosamine kinase family protein n=1 Tax=Synechococcus sp. CCY 9618 TaxID=2815602 RepID=UPI001C24929B|nr:fructosamine kinase family protein [Synechococcus sp. CCY 9618]
MASPDAQPADPLASWLGDRLGVDLVERRPVGGGCIHRAWCLQLADGTRLFAKTNQAAALPLLEAEAEGLLALAAATGEGGAPLLPVPMVHGRMGPEAVLVLSWIDLDRGRSAAQPSPWHRLGAALARLHRRSLSQACIAADRPGAAFGWPTDNFIGSGVQANGWEEDWGRFFVERRLAPQLERLAATAGRMEGADALLALTPGWLNGHGAQPCLVHGDLWSGNAALTVSGDGTVFDPAVYRGDREVDLAMARLFGGFPDAFFAGYEQEWPLPGDHPRRCALYNLYHLLNHANLFGGTYRGQCQEAIRALLDHSPG